MQNVPNIVRDRLRAATPSVDHPDADVLTAFAERSLPGLERTIVLEHLARCGDCRDIVALALPATEPLQAAALHSPRAWLTWPALRWGFVAAGIVAIASFGALRYQRHLRPETVAAPQSPRLEVAANEPKKSLDEFAATVPLTRVKLTRTRRKSCNPLQLRPSPIPSMAQLLLTNKKAWPLPTFLPQKFPPQF